MKLAAEVSNKVSFVAFRTTLNENGFWVQEKANAESEGSALPLDGRGKTDSGT
jgi:hypothetical protein